MIAAAGHDPHDLGRGHAYPLDPVLPGEAPTHLIDVNGLDLDRHLQNEAMALELSSRSEDFREGLAAFRDKRDARFQGR